MRESSFQKHLWLIDTIYQTGETGITYEEINRKWQETAQSKGRNYPLRTFHNHRKEIREVFNIAVLCKKSTNSYYIKQDNDILKKLLELISVQQLLKNDKELALRLSIESNDAGEFSLPGLMVAIKKCQYISLEYQPYWTDKTLKYAKFAPYAIKEFKHKWYLLGRRPELEMEYIDLKMIKSMTVTSDVFTSPAASEITEAMIENYGGKFEQIDTEEITLKVDAPAAGFWRANPLHSSQQEIESKKNYSIFYFYLKPTEEFRRDIISFGAAVEVLAPANLKNDVLKDAKKLERKNS